MDGLRLPAGHALSISHRWNGKTWSAVAGGIGLTNDKPIILPAGMVKPGSRWAVDLGMARFCPSWRMAVTD